VVRSLVLVGELSLSTARLTAGSVATLWVKRPLTVNQRDPLMMGYGGGDLLLAGTARSN